MASIKNRGEKYVEKVLPFFLIKSDETLGQVTAIVSVFGVIDDGNDRIWPGSFIKTITEHASRIRILDQHQTDSTARVLGRPISMQEVGRNELSPEILEKFPTATGGLLTTSQYNMKTQAGSETFHRIVAGDINEYSIGFNALDTDITIEMIDGRKKSVRNIRSIKLWEFSPVIWGLNPATATINAKGKSNLDPQNKDYQEEIETAVDGQPVSLLGDKIHAALSMSFTGLISWLYEEGWLSFAEYSQLQLDGIAKLQELRSLIPDEVALREYRKNFYYMLMNGQQIDHKNSTPVQLPLPGINEDETEEGQSVTPSEAATGLNDDLAGPNSNDQANSPTKQIEELRNRALQLEAKLRIIKG